MSYDVSISCPHCQAERGSFNYTYNLAPMFEWALGGDGLRQLRDMTASDAIPLLERAIAQCESEPDLSRFDSPNGWGNASTALEFLRDILKAAKALPSGAVRVT